MDMKHAPKEKSMDQTYVYEEETEENGLTLKKVGRFFKRGWVTMLVCVVAAVLIDSSRS